MFCSMFHIVMKVRKSSGKVPVPSELPQCLKEDVVLNLGTTVPVRVKEKKWVTQMKTVRVENPKKKTKEKSSSASKEKAPPPLPTEQESGFGAADDWGNDFSF